MLDIGLLESYVKLYDTCVIMADKLPLVDNAANKIRSFKARYESVGKPLQIPWWFIGVIHSLESGCNFTTHLHNGDSLKTRTVNVPKGCPKAGNPPFSWEFSAADALTLKGFQNQDFTLANTLRRLEVYNGLGYRKKGINSPYLWSFSNNYTKGKYVADGKYDPEAVSKQVGAAVILKRMEELKDIAILR